MTLYTDASRKEFDNQYSSAWAFITQGKNRTKQSGKVKDEISYCNTACEFFAIYQAIKYAISCGEKNITVKTDSKTFVDYWTQNITRNPKLYSIVEKVRNIITDEVVVLEFIPAHTGGKDKDSKMNRKADRLAKTTASKIMESRF